VRLTPWRYRHIDCLIDLLMPSFDNRAVKGSVGPSVIHTCEQKELLVIKMSTGARRQHRYQTLLPAMKSAVWVSSYCHIHYDVCSWKQHNNLWKLAFGVILTAQILLFVVPQSRPKNEVPDLLLLNMFHYFCLLKRCRILLTFIHPTATSYTWYSLKLARLLSGDKHPSVHQINTMHLIPPLSANITLSVMSHLH